MEKKEAIKGKIKKANQEAVEKMLSAQPVWVDVGQAGDLIPGMAKNLLLHAGPPQEYKKMCGPQKGAAWGALILEGLAKGAAEADRLLATGKVRIEPAHDHDAVAGAAHMISFSQPAIVLENRTNGKVYYTHMKEDTFIALRYGSYGDHTQRKLKWLAESDRACLLKGAEEGWRDKLSRHHCEVALHGR